MSNRRRALSAAILLALLVGCGASSSRPPASADPTPAPTPLSPEALAALARRHYDAALAAIDAKAASEALSALASLRIETPRLGLDPAAEAKAMSGLRNAIGAVTRSDWAAARSEMLAFGQAYGR